MATISATNAAVHRIPWGALPTRMRVLFVSGPRRTGCWLAEAFATDSAVDLSLEEAVGSTAGAARLREEVFDAVLVSHEPDQLDAIELVEGLRASGAEEPLIVLGPQSEQELAPLCYEVGGDAYVCVHTATVRNLLWLVSRAVERNRLIRENRRLDQAEQRRLRVEHRETERLLEDQRALVRDLEILHDSPAPSREIDAELEAQAEIGRHAAGADFASIPSELIDHYRELLRAYIIMGSGNLTAEMSALTDLLAASNVSSGQTMQLHLNVLEEMVRGLGTRSARHVMTRADLLVLEVIVHLAEGYRQRWLDRSDPPSQRLLPGFDAVELRHACAEANGP